MLSINEVEVSGQVVKVNARNSYVIKTTDGVCVPVFSDGKRNIAATLNDEIQVKGELAADTSLFIKILTFSLTKKVALNI